MNPVVVSFFAPRHDVWGCDYDALLAVLQASCDRLGLSHVCISDGQRPGVATALMPLPPNLMRATIEGQWRFLTVADGPVLLTGADCVLTRDPRPFFDGDITVTVGPFADCPLNTGAVFVSDPRKAAGIWRAALDMNPVEWGDDQKTLHAAMVRARIDGSVDVREVAASAHNWAPESVDDDAGMPTVAHFRGPRKPLMAAWFQRHIATPMKEAA